MPMPIYQHPSQVVLVDDSDSFLRSVAFQLGTDIPCKAFHNAHDALLWLNEHAVQRGWPTSTLTPSFDINANSPDQCNVTLDLDQIYRMSFRPERFDLPTVVVIDYSMPQMNGVDFCRAIARLPCKKILFTGAADERIAVDAFNKGLIDRYIKKNADGALDLLEQEIRILQREYFRARSRVELDVLSVHGYSFVRDQAFATLFYNLCGSLGIVEYYVYPNPAGILMIDAEGNARLMVVETDDSLRAHIEMARDSKAPPSLVAALGTRRVIPFFHQGDGMYSAALGDDWGRYCQTAHVCHGERRYYWALFDLPGDYFDTPALPFTSFQRDQASRSVRSGG